MPKSQYLSGAFWGATAERAFKTLAQTSAGVLTAAGVTSLVGFDWELVVMTAGFSALYSVLSSIGSAALTSDPGPSLSNEITVESRRLN